MDSRTAINSGNIKKPRCLPLRMGLAGMAGEAVRFENWREKPLDLKIGGRKRQIRKSAEVSKSGSRRPRIRPSIVSPLNSRNFRDSFPPPDFRRSTMSRDFSVIDDCVFYHFYTNPRAGAACRRTRTDRSRRFLYL